MGAFRRQQRAAVKAGRSSMFAGKLSLRQATPCRECCGTLNDHGFFHCPRRSSRRAGFPANLTSGGTVSRPLSRIRDGRAPRRAAPLCEDGAVRPHAEQRRRPLGSVWSGCPLGASSQIRRADHEAGFIVVPSGTTPCVTNRHSTMSSLRASATIITFRTRVPVAPARLRYQCTRAEPGW
jgi:hypothetical protein